MPYWIAASRKASRISQRRRGCSTRHSPPSRVHALAQKMIDVFAEERPHVVPRPARQPKLPPLIVIGGLAEHVDHAVDGGRAADHFTTRIIEAATVEARLRLGFQHPIGARIADGEQIADRNVKPDPVVAAARLQQQHAIGRIGRQPVGQHAAGRARAHHDVIELAFDRRRFRHDRILASRADFTHARETC